MTERDDSLRQPAFVAQMDQAFGEMREDLDFLTKLAAPQLEAADGDHALATGWTVRMIYEQEDLASRSPGEQAAWLRAHLGGALVRLALLTKPDTSDLA